MPDQRRDAAPEQSFSRVAGDPGRYRCYGRRALLPEAPGDVPAASVRLMTASEDMPLAGRQEVWFFAADFGLVISDLGFSRDFDYEFVHDEVSFFQFRLAGHSIERASPRHEAVLLKRPGFKFGSPPEDRHERSRLLASSGWRSVTPFVGADSAARLFGPDCGLAVANLAFGDWQRRSGVPVRGLTPEMAAALESIVACPFEGRLRRTFLEAKTIELICLAIDRLGGEARAGPIQVSTRDRDRLEAVRDIIDGRFDDPPTLAEIGRMVGLNRKKLALGFRDHFGTSVLQYCLSHRMRIARALLDEGEPLASVAHRTGYSDQASFSRAFRRHHGSAPGSFRRSSRAP